jgi:hypothetical protein
MAKPTKPRAAFGTRGVQNYQIRNIQILKKALALDDDFYRYQLSQFTRRDGEPVTSSTELTEKQASEIIEKWMNNAIAMGKTVNLYQHPKRIVATQSQIDYLMALAIRCAIHYAPIKSILGSFEVAESECTEQDARDWMLRRWKAKAALPTTIAKHLFMTWANFKANEFLERGGYRENVQKREVCIYAQLTVGECDYLIQRFKAMAQNLDYTNATNTDMPICLN